MMPGATWCWSVAGAGGPRRACLVFGHASVVGVPVTPHIVVVGSTMIDLVAYTPRVPEPGQTLVGERFLLGYGGKGANQAVTAARLGARVTFITRVGNDLFGQLARDNLTRQGIDTSRVTTVNQEPTGVALITVEPDGTNRIIIIPGANTTLTAEDVHTDLASLTNTSIDCVISQLEIPQPAIHEAFHHAHHLGATTILNPAPVADIDDNLLALTDYLVPNQHEFHTLFHTPYTATALRHTARRLHPHLIITLGSDGCATIIQNHVTRIPAPHVHAIDTTAAGDAFIGGLAYGLTHHWPLKRTLTLANACGAHTTTLPGAQTALPHATDVLTT